MPRVDREEAARERARDAARAGDGREERIAVCDRVRWWCRRRHGRRRRSPTRRRRATTPRAARARPRRCRSRSTRRHAPRPPRRRASRLRRRFRAAHPRRPRRGSASRSRCDSASRPRRRGRARPGHRARSRRMPAATIASTHAGESVPMLMTSAPASADHLLDLLARVGHHRQAAERERRIRGLVHDDVVRDLVDEWALLRRRRSESPGVGSIMPLLSGGGRRPARRRNRDPRARDARRPSPLVLHHAPPLRAAGPARAAR